MTIGTGGCTLEGMSDPRERAFLGRLWELQADAGLTDSALAREMGVNHSHVWRAKHDPTRTFGMKFLLGACDRFPELRFYLFAESPILSDACADGGKDEVA